MHIEPAFGTFVPTPIQRALMACVRGTPLGYSRLRCTAVARFKAERPGPVDAYLFGLKVRFHPQDNQTDAKAAVCGSCCNSSELRWLRKALSNGGTFIDVGANMGFFSLFAAKLGAPVIAIEPHPEMFSRLTTNMKLNDFRGTLFNEAVGAIHADARLISGDCDLGSSRIGEPTREGLSVTMRPLLDIIRDARVGMIAAAKIDVVGYEDVALVPFLVTAPESLWPRTIILNHSCRGEWQTDLIKILTQEKGYEQRGVTRANMLLSKSSWQQDSV